MKRCEAGRNLLGGHLAHQAKCFISSPNIEEMFKDQRNGQMGVEENVGCWKKKITDEG